MTHDAGPRRRAGASQRHGELYARLGLTPEASNRDVERAHEEIVRFLEGAPQGLRQWAQAEIAAADEARARISEPAPAGAGRRGPKLRRLAAGAATAAIAVGVVIGVYNMGDDGGSTSSADGPAAAAMEELSPADQEKVVRLIDRAEANPTNSKVLVRLGDIFFAAGDYSTAGGWMEQALEVDPKNVNARLALGAAMFNLGDTAGARRHWLEVIEIDPSNAEAHYDLGFLYLSQDPPQRDRARQAWQKVIELDPDSAIAETVTTHLEGLRG